MIIFFGLAGSGKSVQSSKISSLIGWKHVSAGQVLREYNDAQVQADLKSGRLVDYTITNKLMQRAAAETQGQMVLDGYPRQIEQAHWLIDEKWPIELCVLLDVSVDVIKERLAERGRSDDTDEAIMRRVEIFNSQTREVLDYFKQNGIKIVKINGDASIDEVHEAIAKEVQNVLTAN